MLASHLKQERTWDTDHDDFWKAVLARDGSSDGKFVYAVRSTGIYCRPSCHSRRPDRHHVQFYLMPDAAERDGFRPCRRCEPHVFEERKRLKDECRVAAEIQSWLLPSSPIEVPGWSILGSSIPCHEVGGDYYDFFRRKMDDHVILNLGDVSGKGIGAALLMSSLHAAVRAQSQVSESLSELFAEMNQYIYENTPPNKFITLFSAEVDPDTGVLHYCNAGHNRPILVSSGKLTYLNGSGLPLGVIPSATYESQNVTMASGDVLVAYSDGISELWNEQGEEFGETRLAEIIRLYQKDSPSMLQDRIIEALSLFAGSTPPRDDMSLLIARSLP